MNELDAVYDGSFWATFERVPSLDRLDGLCYWNAQLYAMDFIPEAHLLCFSLESTSSRELRRSVGTFDAFLRSIGFERSYLWVPTDEGVTCWARPVIAGLPSEWFGDQSRSAVERSVEERGSHE